MLSAMTLTAVHLVARFAHLLVYLGIGNVFGANSATDSVLLLQAPLLVIMAVTSGAADMVVMPVMHRAAKEGCKVGLPRMLLLWALKWVVPISLTTLLISFLWLGEASWHVALILLPLPWLSTSSVVFQGILNAQGRYHLAALGPLFGALIAAPLFFLPASAITLAMILVAIEVGRFMALGVLVYPQLSSQPARQNHESLMGWAVQGAIWQALGSLCAALNALVNTLVASQLGEGSVTQIEYASRLWNMVPLLFSGPLTLIHAGFSRVAVSTALSVFRIHRMALLFLVAAIAVGGAFHLVAFWIADLLYGHGRMDTETIHALADTLGIYLLCAIPVIPGLVYVRALSAQGRTRLIAIAAIVAVPLNIVCTLILVPIVGQSGIPLSVLCVLSLNTAILVYGIGIRDHMAMCRRLPDDTS